MHFFQRLRQPASAAAFLVILRAQVHVKNIHLLITAPPGESDLLAVRTPARVVLVVRVPREIKRLATAIKRAQPNIAIEIVVGHRIYNPLAVRTPVVLRDVPALEHASCLSAVGVHHPKIAALLQKTEMLAARTARQPVLGGGVVGQPFQLKVRALPPVFFLVGALVLPQVYLPAASAEEHQFIAVPHRLAFVLRRVGHLHRLAQLRVHHPHVPSCNHRQLKAVLGECHLGCFAQHTALHARHRHVTRRE